MNRLTPADLWTPEEYVERRTEFRRKVLAHKKDRTVRLGPNLTLLFEDRLLVQYQLQELLRAEEITDPDAIREELESYNPLLPDGGNWKATCLLRLEGEDGQRVVLKKLRGIEDRIWVQVGPGVRCTAIADEDLDRGAPDDSSAVHFLRFELAGEMRAMLKAGAALRFGVDHPEYTHAVAASAATARSLLRDLRD